MLARCLRKCPAVAKFKHKQGPENKHDDGKCPFEKGGQVEQGGHKPKAYQVAKNHAERVKSAEHKRNKQAAKSERGRKLSLEKMQVKMRKPNAGVASKDKLNESYDKAYGANGQQVFEKLTHEGVAFGSNLAKGCETFSKIAACCIGAGGGIRFFAHFEVTFRAIFQDFK